MNVSSEATRSLWMVDGKFPRASELKQDLECDVVVVGAGIAGVSTAYELTLASKKVVLVDRGPLLGGITSRTTAHLAPICDDGLTALIDVRGEKIAARFQASQEAAVDRIETLVRQLAIDCDFRRLDAYLFPAPGMTVKDAKKQCDQEFQAAKKARAKVKRVKGIPLEGHEQSPGLLYPNQATFHPLKFLRALIKELRRHKVRIFANSPVVEIEDDGDLVRLTTDAGKTITAAQAVFATNSPICNSGAVHSKMAPYRTYAMAFELKKGALPDALYWDMADPYHYVRLNPGTGKMDYLIAGGRDHKSGEANNGDSSV